MLKIVGIRYIGKKDSQEDTVCKTGAVWLPGQVHNFGEQIAKALLVHTDSFEEAPISMDGGTFLSRGNAKKEQGFAAFVNLTAMGIDQMVHMARLEFNRVVDPADKSEADVRREVHALMTNHSLDMEAERRQEVQGDGKVAVSYMASPEEYAALMAGTVVLAIVPAEVAGMNIVSIKPAESTATPTVNGGGSEKPLPELLAGLDKPELMDFARQEGITFSNNFTAEKLRVRIFDALTTRVVAEKIAA